LGSAGPACLNDKAVRACRRDGLPPPLSRRLGATNAVSGAENARKGLLSWKALVPVRGSRAWRDRRPGLFAAPGVDGPERDGARGME